LVEEVSVNVLELWELFHGACLDTGARRSVIGMPQAEAYMADDGTTKKLKPTKDKASFRFDGGTHPTVGTLAMRLVITQEFLIPLTVDVIQLIMPILLGFTKMDEHRMYFKNATNHFVCGDEGANVPVVRKLGHADYEWDVDVLFTCPEFQKIHKHFFHANPERLYGVMKRAEVKDVNVEALKQLRYVETSFGVCKQLAKDPSRILVSLPADDMCFNRLAYIDLMFLDQQAVLHAVDGDTLFSAAAVLNEQSAAKVWDAFPQMWVTLLVGYPEEHHIHSGSQPRLARFQDLLRSPGIQMGPSEVENHNAVCAGEHDHAFLREVLKRIRADHPAKPIAIAVSMSVWAMIHTARPRGL